MGKLDENTIEQLAQQKIENKSYTQIKLHLKEAGLTETEIKEALKAIDEKVLQAEINRGPFRRSRQIYWSGLILAIAGLLITLGSNAGIILPELSKLVLYAPFFTGIVLLAYARMLQRNHPDPFKKGPGRIKSKRPKKW